MRIGVFSDIHGNIYSFEPIYKKLMKEKLDAYYFCGDICGYYYYHNEIIDILSVMENFHGVSGNHDLMFLESLVDKSVINTYVKKYGSSILEFHENIKSSSIAFLERLPNKYEDVSLNLVMYHGSPWNPRTDYIYPNNCFDRFNKLNHQFVLLGQTHYAMHKKVESMQVINPGSCGQPRDSKPPSYVVLDTISGKVQFHYVPYDPTPLIRDIRKRKEKITYLEEVLLR